MKDWPVSLISTVVYFFTPVVPLLIVAAIAIGIDVYWGVKASQKKGIGFKSRILRKRIVNKLVAYHLVIISFFVIDRFLLNQFIMLYFEHIEFAATKFLTLFIVFIEATSVNENYKIVHGKSLVERFRSMIKTIRGGKETIDELDLHNPK
jgi:hypothetical protein